MGNSGSKSSLNFFSSEFHSLFLKIAAVISARIRNGMTYLNPMSAHFSKKLFVSKSVEII
jgi:hypothetical protein